MKYFGTDGYRGIVNQGLMPIHAYKIGEFLGSYFNNKKILIGSDTRLSKDLLINAISAGINTAGADAYIVGVTTTPSISYLTINDGFACGVMISASHNPYYDNGIKLINKNGEKMEDDVIKLIEDYIDSSISINYPIKDKIGKTIDYSNRINYYIDYLYNLLKNFNKNIKIVIDCANGSASYIAPTLFNKLNINATFINNNPNGININENAGSTHIDILKEYIIKNHYDLGFAYDGDADRCLMVDKYGNILDGDYIIYIYAKYLKNKNELNKNTITTTIMSNYGLFIALDNNNIKYNKTNVGDKYVYENMKEFDISIGGEQSGHIIFSKYAKTGDGILTSLMMLKVINEYDIYKMTKDFTKYPQSLINIKVKNKNIVLNDIDIINEIKNVENQLDNSGRILVRPSDTEPLIRVMVEAKSIDICNKLANKIIDLIKNKGYAL